MPLEYICSRQDMAEESKAAFDLPGGRRVLLLKVEDNVYACDNICPHQEVALEDGIFDGELLTCHQHLWQWNVVTGEPVGLAECPLKFYKVNVEDSAIYVDTDVQP